MELVATVVTAAVAAREVSMAAARAVEQVSPGKLVGQNRDKRAVLAAPEVAAANCLSLHLGRSSGQVWIAEQT